MSLNSLSFNWDLISKWRAHLMGIGILGVMIGHLLEWINANRLVYYAFIPFVGLVFTEGFLLLSGFGLFCSFRKNGSVSNFYNKRAKRLLYPYWIMVIPLCALTILSGESSLNVLLEILTFKYWIFGNTALWYISVTLVLYLLFPLLYNYCFRKGDENIILLRWLLVLVLFYSIGIAIWSLFPNYFDATYLGYTQMPMFIIGMGIGYLYTNKKHLKFEFLIILLIAIAGMGLSASDGALSQYANGLKRFVGVICSCIILEWLSNKTKWKFTALEWFGNLSLELYILHILFRRVLAPYFDGRTCAVISILSAIVIAPFVNKLINKFVLRERP